MDIDSAVVSRADILLLIQKVGKWDTVNCTSLAVIININCGCFSKTHSKNEPKFKVNVGDTLPYQPLLLSTTIYVCAKCSISKHV